MTAEQKNLKLAQNAANKLNDATVQILQLETEIDCLKEEIAALQAQLDNRQQGETE